MDKMDQVAQCSSLTRIGPDFRLQHGWRNVLRKHVPTPSVQLACCPLGFATTASSWAAALAQRLWGKTALRQSSRAGVVCVCSFPCQQVTLFPFCLLAQPSSKLLSEAPFIVLPQFLQPK